MAEDRLPLDKCLADIGQCNVYLGFFAWRYGFVPPGHTQAITEQEYRRARANGASCLCFLTDKSASWPVEHIDPDRGPIEKLRNETSQTKLIGFFRDEQSLAQCVADALDPLESERRDLAAKRRLDPVIAAAITNIGLLLACLLPLVLCWYLL